MKKGGWVALLLLLIGALGAYVWYQRQKEKASQEPYGTALKPRLELSKFEITDIADDAVSINMKMLIDNPLPVSFKARELDYAFYIDTTLISKDLYKKAIEIESSDSSLVTLPVKVFMKRTNDLLKELEQRGVDSVDYRVQATFAMDVPVLGERTFKVEGKKRLPALRLPKVKVQDIDWGKISFKETDLAAKVEITNPNVFPIHFTDTHYKVLIDEDLVAEGSQPEPIIIPKNSTRPVVFPVTLKPGKFDNVAWKALFKKKKTSYLIEFRSKLVSPDGNSAFDKSQLVSQIKGTLADLKKK